MIRQFRIRANTPDEAAEACHAKCPEHIVSLKLWRVFDNWWECQAVCGEVNESHNDEQ